LSPQKDWVLVLVVVAVVAEQEMLMAVMAEQEMLMAVMAEQEMLMAVVAEQEMLMAVVARLVRTDWQYTTPHHNFLRV